MAGKGPRTILGDYITLQRGTTYKSILLGQPGPVLLGLATIQRNGGFRTDSLQTYGGDSPEKLLVYPGELYLSLKDVTQSADLLGAVARLPRDHPTGRLTQDTVKLEPKGVDVPLDYLYWLLRTPQYRSYCRAHATGTTNLGFAREDFLAFPAPEPTLTQTSVVKTLETLDDKIELYRRMNETLEVMARALFKSWFVDFEPVRAKVEGRNPGLPKTLADLFPDSFEDSELREVPKGWDVKPLSDCVDIARGLSYKGLGLSESGVPMHNLNSIYEGGGYKQDGLKRYDGDYKSHHIARAGDLLVANTEQGHDRLLIGYAAIVPDRFGERSLFSHHIYRVRPQHSSKMTADYMCHLLNTNAMHDVVSNYANGTTVNMLPVDALQSPLIVVPPARAIAVFSGIAKAARLRHEEMIEESCILAALRDALLPKLISGELRVTSQRDSPSESPGKCSQHGETFPVEI